MEKKDPIQLPHKFIMTHHDITISLLTLLERSNLAPEVIQHCKTGLKVIEVIYTDLGYNTGTKFLLRKEFDQFLKSFPNAYFNNRELISVNMIAKNIESCIITNRIMTAC